MSSTDVLDLCSFESYVAKTQDCFRLAETDEAMLQDLLALAHAQKKLGTGSEDYTQFLKAEEAFYNGNYRQALKYYLQAREIPQQAFFCLRASAYVSHEMGKEDKAIHYIRKALRVYPNDYLCLQLLKKLLKKKNQVLEAEAVEEQVAEIRGGAVAELQACQQVGLGDEEMEELANLFVEEEETMSVEEEMHYTATAVEEEQTVSHTPFTPNEANDPSAMYFGNHPMPPSSDQDPLRQLQDLAESTAAEISSSSTVEFITGNLGISLDTGPSLEQRVNAFQRSQADCMSQYIENYGQRSRLNDKFLLVLNGWDYQVEGKSSELKERLLPASYRRTSGGYFVRWKEKGVVINPGPKFLEKFHDHGLHIKDIDYVIVTQDSPYAYADVQAIYDLNYALNKMDAQLHIINYYLNQQAHRHLSPRLKPHFKQERNTIHSLELFVDSPDTESLILDECISLHYFATSAQEASQVMESKGSSVRTSCAVGIRLALRSEGSCDERSTVQLGYISGAAYSPILAHHLSACDTLIAAWEDTGTNDYQKIQYNENSLGYYGSATLLEELGASLLICCEYSGREGDVRVEGSKKLRQDETSSQHPTSILPGDTGMIVDLETQRVQCSLTQHFVDASQVHVVKTQEAFGQLKYLSNSCFV